MTCSAPPPPPGATAAVVSVVTLVAVDGEEAEAGEDLAQNTASLEQYEVTGRGSRSARLAS